MSARRARLGKKTRDLRRVNYEQWARRQSPAALRAYHRPGSTNPHKQAT